MATIFDVARVAGVSRSTVSRVLNDQPGVSDNARARVLTAIQQLNYQPNFAARALKRQKADTLGLIVPPSFRERTSTEPRGYYLTEIIRGAYNAVIEHRQVLALLDDGGNPEFYDRLIQHRQVDGILIVDLDLDEPLLTYFSERKFPFVVIGNPADETIACVDVDNYGSAQRVVRYLYRLGHTQIAMIHGPPARLASRDRAAGYRTMLRQLGFQVDPALQAEGDFSEESGQCAMEQLLGTVPRPTAVFAANDRMALGAIRAVQARGLRVPEDISIVGFDDIPVAAYVQPALTTMRQPLYDLGNRAARLLLEMTETERSPFPHTPRVVLPTQLIERRSVGHVNGRPVPERR
ncbi:MAG: LacI family transcriptional regulator [Ardenticatenaceae bacterium]|nr:LacI family transcriptional regulator [Ardenticatenaceae bacterium]